MRVVVRIGWLVPVFAVVPIEMRVALAPPEHNWGVLVFSKVRLREALRVSPELTTAPVLMTYEEPDPVVAGTTSLGEEQDPPRIEPNPAHLMRDMEVVRSVRL